MARSWATDPDQHGWSAISEWITQTCGDSCSPRKCKSLDDLLNAQRPHADHLICAQILGKPSFDRHRVNRGGLKKFHRQATQANRSRRECQKSQTNGRTLCLHVIRALEWLLEHARNLKNTIRYRTRSDVVIINRLTEGSRNVRTHPSESGGIGRRAGFRILCR